MTTTTAQFVLPTDIPQPDVDQIAAALQLLIAPGDTHELRAPDIGRRDKNFSQHFTADSTNDAARWAVTANGGRNVYVTLNPVKPGVPPTVPVKDADIFHRRWLLIDVDPRRTAGTNATDAEKAAADGLASSIRTHLRDECGWPEAVVADSGNGSHLLYRIDLPADDGGLVYRVLNALAKRFDTGAATVDTAVANPSRICKLYGTVNRKGQHASDRPQRVSRILEVPVNPQPVSRKQLEAVAHEAPMREAHAAGTRATAAEVLDGRQYAVGVGAVDTPDRIERFLHVLPHVSPAVQGEHGHDRLFEASCLAVRDFAIDPTAAIPILWEHYNPRCIPPWDPTNPADQRDFERKTSEADDFTGVRGLKLLQSIEWEANRDLETWNDPARLARRFAEREPWRWWRGCYYRYTGTHYGEVSEASLRAELYGFIRDDAIAAHAGMVERAKKKGKKMPTVPHVVGQLVSNTLLALNQLIAVPDTFEMPCFLNDGSREHRIPLKNGLLDPQNRSLHPHTPDYFSTVVLPFDYDPVATCPEWDRALATYFGDDRDRSDLLAEWYGYCLVPETKAHAFMVWVGDGANGKGTASTVLQALVGEANVSSAGLEAFASNFGLMDTIGKLLNVCDDLNSLDDGAKIAEGRLKSFVSGNAIQIDRKGLRPVRVTPTARLLFLTNELPTFRDRSSGVWRRLIVVPFDRRIENKVPGMDRPEFWRVELPGILNWALDGLDRLRKNNWRFTEPAACRQAREEHRVASNPAREFLVERYKLAEGGFVASSTLYTEYTLFCDTHGYRGKLSKRKFGDEVRRCWPTVESDTVRQPGVGTSTVVRGWRGLRRNLDAEVEAAA